jgi:hypothetical protein
MGDAITHGGPKEPDFYFRGGSHKGEVTVELTSLRHTDPALVRKMVLDIAGKLGIKIRDFEVLVEIDPQGRSQTLRWSLSDGS